MNSNKKYIPNPTHSYKSSRDTSFNAIFMDIAIKLAQTAGVETLPNPCVGAVVVKDNKILGKGYTQAYGGLHAEAVALQEAGTNAKGAELYCTLEPCTGSWKQKKQPPCTQKILESGIKKVYIACFDSNPHVHKKGVEFLRTHNIEVVLCDEYTQSYKRINEVFEFLQHNNTRIPFVHVKIAQDINGAMTNTAIKAERIQVAITDSATRAYVHALRANSQVLMTSARTIHIDNPQFTVRDAEGINPALFIIDTHLSINPEARIFLDKEERRVLSQYKSSVVVVCNSNAYHSPKRKILEEQGAEVIVANTISYNSTHTIDMESLLKEMYNKEIYSVMLESGPTLSTSILKQNLASKLTCLIAAHSIPNGYGIKDMHEELYMATKNIYNAKDAFIPLYHIDDTHVLYYVKKERIENSNDICISAYCKDMFST